MREVPADISNNDDEGGGVFDYDNDEDNTGDKDDDDDDSNGDNDDDDDISQLIQREPSSERFGALKLCSPSHLSRTSHI